MTTAHQGHLAGYACGAGHGCSLLACQPAEAAMLALMPRPCKCNGRFNQGIGDISGANPLLSAHPSNVIMEFWLLQVHHPHDQVILYIHAVNRIP